MPIPRRVFRIALSLAGACVLLSAAQAVRADALLVITTDSNLNDNGGADDFITIPDDGKPHTVYIWAAGTPTGETLVEFNFDLSASGADLSFTNAAIAPGLANIARSLSDTNLNDQQFGWSAFVGVAPQLAPCPSYTLLATIEVTAIVGARVGPETTLALDGPQFRLLSRLTPDTIIPAIGPWRNLAVSDLALLCDDLAAVCGDGVVEGDEQCDPPDGMTCDFLCQRIPLCGDGVVDAPESCDDGGQLSGDGCDASCQLEPLLNDNCADSTTIGDGATLFYTNDATTDGPSHSGVCQFDGQTYNDIWFDYTASCTGDLTVSLCGSDYDTDLVVYDSCTCPTQGSAPLACNDDGCPGIPPLSYRSEVVTPVTTGSCYKIRLGGFTAGDAGAGTVTITCGQCTIDADCSDGIFCNGAESCNAGVCTAGSDPCPGVVCVESAQSCTPPLPGDTDLDGDVDLVDAAKLADCLNGLATSLPGCESADFNGDNHVDLLDTALQQANFTGPN